MNQPLKNSNTLNKFVRFGNLTPKKQNGYGNDTYHSPPAKYGFYAMPFKYQEFFLISSLSKTQPNIFGKDKRKKYFDNNKELWNSIKLQYDPKTNKLENVYDTPEKKKFKKDLDDLDKKFEDKYRQIRKEFSVDDDKELWHHLVDDVKLSEILQRNNSWVKTTVRAWKKAVQKNFIYLASNNSLKTNGKRSGPIQYSIKYFSKDHFEVFFDSKV